MVSLLRACWGSAATADNDYCFDYLPRIDGDHSTYQSMMAMLDGTVHGFFVMGENPAVGSANGKLHRLAMAKLDWLVVRDLAEIETATFWRNSPEIETGELRTEDIGTEVFFLPAAAHTEKDGSFTQTQRLLQWHHQAVEPPGDCRSELWFTYHLGRIIREKLAGSTDPRDRPLLDLTWDYPTGGPIAEPDAEAVLREINGWDATPSATRQLHGVEGGRLNGLRLLDLLRLLRRRREPDRAPKARVRAEPCRARVGMGVAGEPAVAVQPGLGRARRDAVVRGEALRVVGCRRARVGRPRHT